MQKRKSAQVLVVTLMVLIIVAIIVVGVVAVATRDVASTITDQRYNELYNTAERAITGLIDKYGDPTEPLSNLAQSTEVPAGYACSLGGAFAGQYTCNFNGSLNRVFIRDSRDVIGFELAKDDSLTLNMNGYRGNINVSWQGTAALEFSLIYNNAGVISNINDLYDNNSPQIFTDNGGNPITDPRNTHAFPFANNPSGGIRFTVGSITGLPAGATTHSLRITPRMSGSSGNILLNVSGTAAGYPNQVRIFEAAVLPNNGDVGVLAEAVTQIPLFPQIVNLFHYGLLVRGQVVKI